MKTTSIYTKNNKQLRFEVQHLYCTANNKHLENDDYTSSFVNHHHHQMVQIGHFLPGNWQHPY